MNEDLELIKRLESLQHTHRDLDQKISLNGLDEFTRKRLQKEKLHVKDQIYLLEQTIYPDVPA